MGISYRPGMRGEAGKIGDKEEVRFLLTINFVLSFALAKRYISFLGEVCVLGWGWGWRNAREFLLTMERPEDKCDYIHKRRVYRDVPPPWNSIFTGKKRRRQILSGKYEKKTKLHRSGLWLSLI